MVVSTIVRDAVAALVQRLADYADDAGIELNVYRHGDVPPWPETDVGQAAYYPYVVVWAAQRTDTGARRVSDDSGHRPFRAVTQVAADAELVALWAEDHVDAALRGVRLDMGDVAVTRLRHEAGTAVGPDPEIEGLYVGTASWTWVATAI